MNKKGFTVVELLASFTLTMIIVVFLFEIVLELKDVYVANTLKTKVLNQNALIATKLEKELDKLDINTTNCSGSTCNLYEPSGPAYTITITSSDVSFNGASSIQMPSGVSITNVSVSSQYNSSITDISKDNAYIKVDYTVTSKNLNDDIKFNYVYSYHQG